LKGIPLHIEQMLDVYHIKAKDILYFVRGDAADDGTVCDVYLLLEKNCIHKLSGVESVSGVKGARRLETTFTLSSFETIDLRDVAQMKTERMISTSSLIAYGEEPRLIAVFPIGQTDELENLQKAFEAVQEGRPVAACEWKNDRCPRCGTRYPEQERKVCPNCLNKISVAGRLFGFFEGYMKNVVSIVAVMLMSTAFSLLSPYIGTKLLFDEVLVENGKYYGMILGMIGLIFFVRLIGVVCDMIYQYVLASILPWVVYDIKVKIFTAMQKLSTGYYTSKQTGDLMTRVNRDSNNIYWFFVDGLPYVIVNSFLFIGVSAVMFWMNATLALITILAIPIVILIFKGMWKTFRGLHHKIWISEKGVNATVSDGLNGQRVVKAFAKEATELKRFAQYSDKLAESEVNLARVECTAFPLVYFFMFAIQVIVTAVGSFMVIYEDLSLGTLLTFISYLTLLYGPLEFMSWVSNWWSRCVDSAQRVFEIVDARSDVEEPEYPVDKQEIIGEIEFEDVTFCYEPARPVIDHMSIHIEAGQMLGIVGKAGAGKSTMANLMARLYDPTSGVVRIDGIDVRQYETCVLRSNIGIVSQEIYLFIGTIADNIRYANPQASIEAVIAAAKAAGAHEFIMRLPDAYETRVGAGGQDLSGGERQRLSIARTIIQNPKILILDEATAAMDTETERKIQESINRLKSGRTTIAIAHRLSTLRDADKLAVVNNGRVTEYGTHNELFALQDGEYRKLFLLQLEALKHTSIGE